METHLTAAEEAAGAEEATETEGAAKAEGAAKERELAAAAKKNPERFALIDKYLAVYPQAEAIRRDLVADSKMDGGRLAEAIRNFMDRRIGA